MNTSLGLRPCLAFEPLPAGSADAVLTLARRLQLAALAGRSEPLLRGKNLGLLSEHEDSQDARLFHRAATELGAQVAQLRARLSAQTPATDLQHTARLLGRLYDAVECQGLPAALVSQVGAAAGVPVYDGVATAAHPTAPLSERLGGGGSPADHRRFVLQAVLLGALA